jgi:hypothetical protein
VVSIVSLECPVCGAPFSPGAERCAYCGSILVLQTDHPRIDPRALNRAVIDERITGFRQTLRQDPSSVTAFYGLGVAYYNLGLTEAAIRELEHACRLTPENPHIHTQLAVAYREEQRSGNPEATEEMEDHIQYALRLDPENVEALLLRAELSLDREHYDEAVGHLTRAYAREPGRVRERLRDALLAAIRWREGRGLPTDADRERLRQVDPGAVLPSAQPGVSLPSLNPATRAELAGRVSIGKARLKGVVKGFLLGIGLGFVSMMVLAMLSNTVEEDSAGYNVIIVLVLISFLLPIVLAVRGWYVGGRAAADKKSNL